MAKDTRLKAICQTPQPTGPVQNALGPSRGGVGWVDANRASVDSIGVTDGCIGGGFKSESSLESSTSKPSF